MLTSLFIHSGHFYSAPSSPLLLRGAPDYSTETVSEFHAENAQTTAGKGLAQGPYVAARAGVEPTTLRLKAIDSTKAPPCPTCRVMFTSLCHVMKNAILPPSLLVCQSVCLSKYLWQSSTFWCTR